MTIPTGIAIYFLVWWITLFAVLPFGIRSQQEGGDVSPGTDPGAPGLPALGKKLIWTTIVSTIVFGIGTFLYVRKIVSLDDMVRWLGV